MNRAPLCFSRLLVDISNNKNENDNTLLLHSMATCSLYQHAATDSFEKKNEARMPFQSPLASVARHAVSSGLPWTSRPSSPLFSRLPKVKKSKHIYPLIH